MSRSKDLAPWFDECDKDGNGFARAMRVRAVNGPHRGKNFRVYREVGDRPFNGPWPSALTFSNGLVYDLEQIDGKWALVHRKEDHE